MGTWHEGDILPDARHGLEGAQEAGLVQTSRFYDDVTNLYIQKYGYEMADKDDLEEDVADPHRPEPARERCRDAQSSGSSASNEATRPNTRVVWSQRIGQWYRAQYGGNVDKGAQTAIAEMLLSGLDLHYEERVKGRFEPAWKLEVQRCKDLDLEEPHEVAVRSSVTREAWEGESAEFRAAVLLQMESDYKVKVRAWEIGRLEDTLRTKEELAVALNSAATILQPLVDAIGSKFQMNASILVCGPVGDRGGTIQVRSVHSGRTLGLNPKKWYDTDRIGYREAEKSMILFAERCFSAEECLRRALPGTTGASGDRALVDAGGGGQLTAATLVTSLDLRTTLARLLRGALSRPSRVKLLPPFLRPNPLHLLLLLLLPLRRRRRRASRSHRDQYRRSGGATI
ncbi:hypothetical protein C8R46DRAFT_1221056 [Mycena filopes]|nr:hypothetical protein C8R46DRAFT_1221056 [Mycena filopes]